MLGLSDHLTFAVHGGGDSGDGLASGVAGLLTFIEGLVRQTPSETFASLLPGISALQNLHPLFVHFPIVLLTLFFLIDAVGSLADRAEWRQVASWFLYLGTAFAGMTVAAGLLAANSVVHGGDVHEIMEHHEHLGISVLSLSAALSVWRLVGKGVIVGVANTLYLLLAAILCGLLVFTADLGGLMVYKYGVAVEAADKFNQAAALAHEHDESDTPATADHPESDHDDVEHPGHHDESVHEATGHHHDHQHAH